MSALWRNMNMPARPVNQLTKYARCHFNTPLVCGRVVIYTPGASFIGMHVTCVKPMCLYHWEGHSWVLDMATARVCLMSQRADRWLMGATAPHTACYFYLSKGNPRNYPIKSCPCTHPCQRLSLEVTDFEAAGLWSIQILSDCCSSCSACYESRNCKRQVK